MFLYWIIDPEQDRIQSHCESKKGNVGYKIDRNHGAYIKKKLFHDIHKKNSYDRS